jgi:flagellar biosynthesis chaperone FliJ
MWQRFKRMVRSNLGRLNDLAGPGDALKGEQLQLEKGLSEVQRSIAELKGQLHVLEEKQRKATRREPELKALVEAAQQRNNTELVVRYGSELETVRSDQTSVVRQLAVAREALEKGERARATFVEALAKKKAEIQEHRRVLAELEAEDAGNKTNHDADLALARAGLFDAGPAVPTFTPAPGAPGLQSPLTPTAAVDDAAPRSKTIGAEATPASGIATPLAGPKTIGASPETPPTGSPAANGKTIGIGPIVVTPPAVAAEPRADAAPRAPLPVEKLAIKVRPLGGAAVTAPPTADTRTPARDVVGELERLAALHAAGALTDDEMAHAKKRLLGGL